MRPLVLVPCDVKHVEGHPFHGVGEKYINAVSHGAGVQALLVPGIGAGQDLLSLEQDTDIDGLLDLAQGLFLTGSVSNVEPGRYGNSDAPADIKQDHQRDATVFPLLARAIARKIPILAVCRGIQELNVAIGGTLYHAVHEQPGYADHREQDGLSRAELYAPAHDVDVVAGGLLEKIVDAPCFAVNSLHAQAIAILAPGLRAEAISKDGVIEAVSKDGQFLLGVQWHPEWAFADNPQSKAIFAAFGQAVRHFATNR
ncbi:MAG: gamma-glutamyl-gamma-aminobutyrate hydrolase family protein [Pseudomonadales bacterium]|jgi:putative glutamine amidotransferase|nr:gamma-glutamyl-gamma-aminobutyrate hydrolase family protein [Pseudomonadales bacterium]